MGPVPVPARQVKGDTADGPIPHRLHRMSTRHRSFSCPAAAELGALLAFSPLAAQNAPTAASSRSTVPPPADEVAARVDSLTQEFVVHSPARITSKGVSR